MTLAALYARFSPRPDAAECDSIVKQLERCRAYCLASGYEIIGEFNDADLSGGRMDNRPGLQAAIELACQRKAVLVCFDLSRLARHTSDAIAIAEKLQAAGANLAFLDMKLDTSSPTGRCFFTIMAAFAQLYREQISERTSKAMQRHQRNGRKMSRYAPFGWMIDPKDASRLLVDKDEQRALRLAQELLSEGATTRQVCTALRKAGVSFRGRAWCSSVLRKALEREKA